MWEADKIVFCLKKFMNVATWAILRLFHWQAISYFMYLLHSDSFDTIWHKFLVHEHTYMPCNCGFGLIEAEKDESCLM